MLYLQKIKLKSLLDMIFDMNPVIFWLIVTAVLFIIEMMSFTVALLCLCLGCIGAIVAALCGLSVAVQAAVAAVLTIIIFFAAGAKIRKYFNSMRRSQLYTSNMDAIIGREGRVTSTVTRDYADGGRVQVDGDSWQAYTTSPEPINIGSCVVIEAYDSIIVRVRLSSPKL